MYLIVKKVFKKKFELSILELPKKFHNRKKMKFNKITFIIITIFIARAK